MKSSPAMKIRAPYRHDLGRQANTRRLGGLGNTGLERTKQIEQIGKQILEELLSGKECRFCAQEREEKGVTE